MEIKNKFKVTQMGSNIYMYKENTLVASYSKEIGRLYTYGLSKEEKRKVIKVIKATLKEGKVTKQQAKEFYRKLCVTVYGNENQNCCGIMPVALIADHMEVSIEKANLYCNAMVKHGITERSNGMIIV